MNDAVINSSASAELTNFFGLLFSVYGVGALVAVILLFIALLVFRQMRWVIIAFLAYFSTLSFYTMEGQIMTGQSMLAPLREMIIYGRGLCGLALVLLLIPAIMSERAWRHRLILACTWWFFFLELFYVLRPMDPARSGLGVVTFILTFLTFAWGVGRWLQGPQDADAAVRSITWAGMLFLAATLTQAAIDSSQVTWNGRLFGTTGNPNHCGVLMGITLTPTLYLLVVRRGWDWARMLYAVVAALMVVMLLWAGSRTGLVIAGTGTLLLFRRRLGALAVAVILCGLILLAVWPVIQPQSGALEHIFSAADTRNDVWNALVQQFLSSPIVGVTGEEARFSENSYLLIAARTGMVGVLLLGVMLLLLVRSLVRMARLRQNMPAYQPMIDLIIAGVLSILCGAIFEGFLTDVYGIAMYALYTYLALMAFVLDVAATQGPNTVDNPFETETLETTGYPSLAIGGELY